MKSNLIPFDSLEPFPKTTNFIEILRDVSDKATTSLNPEEQINTINQLRRMRKYTYQLFEVTFNNIISLFLSVYLNGNDNIEVIYSLLIFFTEIFSELKFDFNENWIKQIFLAIEDFLFCSNKLISDTAKNLVKTIAENMHFTTMIQILFDALKDSDQEKANFIEGMFDILLRNIDDVNLIHYFDWNDIVQKINGKCSEENTLQYKCVRNVFLKIKSFLGDEWEVFMQGLSDEESKNKVGKFIN